MNRLVSFQTDSDEVKHLVEDENDIDEYFNDLFPDRNRLDTVEEVTEPMSSFHESLPLDLDMAKIGSSGQPSSDFMNDSLPPDLNPITSSARTSMTLSMTSREEFCAVSEVEVLASTWPPIQLKEQKGKQLEHDRITTVMTILVSDF